MLNKIWQFLKQLIQRLFKTQPSHPPAQQKPLPPTMTDAEYEAKFMELLEGVNQGWSRGDVAGFLIAKRLKDAELAAWLRRFGKNLLANAESAESEKTEVLTTNLDQNLNPNSSVESLQEMARRLLLLSRIRDGELGNVAREISREILARFPLPIVEDDGGNGEVIEAVFVGDGLGIIADITDE
ncbi:MAG: hypothetical protein WCD53_01605 [Microcoleus sp.]